MSDTAAEAEANSGTERVSDNPSAPELPEEGRAKRRIGLATVLAVLFAVLSVFLAFVATSLKSDLDRKRDEANGITGDRADVTRVAGDFSAALLTYKYDDLDAAKKRVLSLSTGTFATQYEQAFKGLAALLTSTKSQARATVKDVFVEQIEGDRAHAITVLDADVAGTSGPRNIVDSYVRLDLVRTKQGWKVDGVTSLNFTPGSGVAAPSGSGTG